jgi:hypothetical protein
VSGRIGKIASPRLGDGMVLADSYQSNIRLAEEVGEVAQHVNWRHARGRLTSGAYGVLRIELPGAEVAVHGNSDKINKRKSGQLHHTANCHAP